jgi:hypothetical protein
MLTVEELLRDRIKIIADYPGNKFKVGDILTYSHNFLPTMIVGVGNQIWRNQEGVIVSYNKLKTSPTCSSHYPGGVTGRLKICQNTLDAIVMALKMKELAGLPSLNKGAS